MAKIDFTGIDKQEGLTVRFHLNQAQEGLLLHYWNRNKDDTFHAEQAAAELGKALDALGLEVVPKAETPE